MCHSWATCVLCVITWPLEMSILRVEKAGQNFGRGTLVCSFWCCLQFFFWVPPLLMGFTVNSVELTLLCMEFLERKLYRNLSNEATCRRWKSPQIFVRRLL